VRHTLDDCFEFFGGTVSARHLICQYNQDDGFDWDNGYRGTLQYLVLQQDPLKADDMNGFEGDNYADKSAYTPLSAPIISNATLCAPCFSRVTRSPPPASATQCRSWAPPCA